MGWWGAGGGGIPTLLGVQWWVQMGAFAQRPCSGSVCPHHGAGALVPLTPPPLPAVTPAVKLQYVDNIRWIQEAAKHQLVRLQLWRGWGGSVDLVPGEMLLTIWTAWGVPTGHLAQGHCSEKPFRRWPGLWGSDLGQAGPSSHHGQAGP